VATRITTRATRDTRRATGRKSSSACLCGCEHRAVRVRAEGQIGNESCHREAEPRPEDQDETWSGVAIRDNAQPEASLQEARGWIDDGRDGIRSTADDVEHARRFLVLTGSYQLLMRDRRQQWMRRTRTSTCRCVLSAIGRLAGRSRARRNHGGYSRLRDGEPTLSCTATIGTGPGEGRVVRPHSHRFEGDCTGGYERHHQTAGGRQAIRVHSGERRERVLLFTTRPAPRRPSTRFVKGRRSRSSVDRAVRDKPLPCRRRRAGQGSRSCGWFAPPTMAQGAARSREPRHRALTWREVRSHRSREAIPVRGAGADRRRRPIPATHYVPASRSLVQCDVVARDRVHDISTAVILERRRPDLHTTVVVLTPV
jgi:hypothetical protein